MSPPVESILDNNKMSIFPCQSLFILFRKLSLHCLSYSQVISACETWRKVEILLRTLTWYRLEFYKPQQSKEPSWGELFCLGHDWTEQLKWLWELWHYPFHFSFTITGSETLLLHSTRHIINVYYFMQITIWICKYSFIKL